MGTIHTDQASLGQSTLPPHAKYFPGLDDDCLSPAQLSSIQLLQKAIQGGSGDPVFGRLVAYVMHDILEDFKPRRLLSKSGETRALILPLSAAEARNGVAVCFAEGGGRTIHVCDVDVPEVLHPDKPTPSPAVWAKSTTEKVSEALRYEGMESLLHPKLSSLQIFQRLDADLHTLFYTPRIRYILNTELNDRLFLHFSWARDLGIGGPGVEWLCGLEPLGKLSRGLVKLASAHIKSDLDNLIEPIIPNIYESLRASPQCYTGDIQKASRATCPLVQTRRARWLACFPLYRSLVNDKSALSLIDSDKLTMASLSERAGVSQAYVRRMREWPASTLAQAGVPDPLVFTKLLARVDINHLPQYRKVSREELKALASTVAGVSELVGSPSDTPLTMNVAQSLLKNAGGKWSGQAEHRAVDDVKHAADFIQIFSKRTVLAALLRLERVAEAVTSPGQHQRAEIARAKEALERVERLSTKLLLAGLSGHWSLANILQASQSWHEVVGKSGFVGALQVWPALCERLEAPSGVQLIPLTTSAELADEGKLMSHCVGGYVLQCRTGRSHIFSIRDPDGKRLSTLQLNQEQFSVKEVQNRSFANQQPEKRAVEAAQWLVEQINSGELEIDWNVLFAEQMRSRRDTGISQILGFDPHDRALWNKAFSEFKGYCRGSLRAATAEDFVRGLIKEIRRQNVPLGKLEAKLLMLLEKELGRR